MHLQHSSRARKLFVIHSLLFMAQKSGKFMKPTWASVPDVAAATMNKREDTRKAFLAASSFFHKNGFRLGDALLVWGTYYFQTATAIDPFRPVMSKLVSSIGAMNKLHLWETDPKMASLITEMSPVELFRALRSGSLAWTQVDPYYDKIAQTNSVWFNDIAAPSYALAHKLVNVVKNSGDSTNGKLRRQAS